MAENNKIYITANELAEMLGVSVGHAYRPPCIEMATLYHV